MERVRVFKEEAVPTILALAVAAAAWGFTPTQQVVVDHVDLVEVNHFYDEHGKRVFDQVIFYDWCADAGRYNVRAWRLLKTQDQVPLKNWQRGDYAAVWHDGDILREVRSRSIRETWTQYDPELVEREFLPKEQRRELSRIATRKRPVRAEQAAEGNAPATSRSESGSR
jgi:hypothetical protein